MIGETIEFGSDRAGWRSEYHSLTENLSHGAIEVKNKVISVVHQVEVANHVRESVNEAAHHTEEENNRDMGPYEIPGASGVSEFDPIGSALANHIGKELAQSHIEEQESENKRAGNS